MSLAKALIMLFVLVVGVFYLLNLETLGSVKQHATDDKRLLAQVDAEDKIKKIEVKFEQTKYGLVPANNEDKDWILVDPSEAPTDETAVDAILASLVSLHILKTVPDEELESDTAVYGFGPSSLSVVVTLADDSEKPVKLQFGKKHSISGRRYIRENEGPIHLVEDNHFTAFPKSIFEIRQRQPIEFDPNEVQAIWLRRGQFDLQKLNRDTEGRWRYASGDENFIIDSDMIEKNLNSLASLTVEEIIDVPNDNLTIYGFEPPTLSIALVREQQANEPNTSGGSYEKTDEPLIDIPEGSVVVYFGERSKTNETIGGGRSKKEFYFQISGSSRTYRYSKPTYADFLQPIDHLRDRTPLDEISLAKVARVAVIPGDKKIKSFVLTQRDGDTENSIWTIKENPETTEVREVSANKRFVEQWVSELLQTRILTYLGNEGDDIIGENIENPLLRLDIFITEREKPYSLLFGNSVLPGSEDVESTAPPRYGAVQTDDGALVPAVLSSADWNHVQKKMSDFLSPPATTDSAGDV